VRHGWAQSLRKTWVSFLNLFVNNDKRRWNQSYEEGHWTFLDSPQQSPRHYVIAGMLASLGEAGSHVLDVGCGTGALLPHLGSNVVRYVGIDLSSEAIRLCNERRDSCRDHAFIETAFEEYSPGECFDAIVFNEMLYYYSMSEIPAIIDRARNLLTRPTGTIIVSIHNRSLKRYHVWRRLQSCLVPAESTEITDMESGSSWRIRRYRVDRADP